MNMSQIHPFYFFHCVSLTTVITYSSQFSFGSQWFKGFLSLKKVIIYDSDDNSTFQTFHDAQITLQQHMHHISSNHESYYWDKEDY
jgi:hypothetical protein